MGVLKRAEESLIIIIIGNNLGSLTFFLKKIRQGMPDPQIMEEI